MSRTMDSRLCVADRSLMKFHGRDSVDWNVSMPPIRRILPPVDHIVVADKI